MKKIVLLVFILFLPFLVNANTKETVKFVRCVDGDTAVFLINDIETKVRFLAIDTPETVHPIKNVEAYGKNASEYTCNKITNAKKIELEYDDASDKLDKYKRTLAWVWTDNTLLQKELIEIGYAKVKYIYGNYKYTNELYEVEEKAKKAKLGLWHDEEIITHTVTFDNDGTLTKINVEDNQTIDKLLVNKEGYEFISWQLNGKDFDFDTKITKDITLTANYQKNISNIELIIIGIIIGLYIVFKPKKAYKKIKKVIKNGKL